MIDLCVREPVEKPKHKSTPCIPCTLPHASGRTQPQVAPIVNALSPTPPLITSRERPNPTLNPSPPQVLLQGGQGEQGEQGEQRAQGAQGGDEWGEGGEHHTQALHYPLYPTLMIGRTCSTKPELRLERYV